MELKNYVCGNTEPVLKEMCLREKLDNIYAIVSECEGLTNCINGRLYNPVPCNPVSGNNPSDTIESKLQTLYSTAMNLCDNLRYINDKL
jgi:hypothetical protein